MLPLKIFLLSCADVVVPRQTLEQCIDHEDYHKSGHIHHNISIQEATLVDNYRGWSLV